ncbi:hypothetical protein ACER0A_006595 [Haloimpatiens sp. FM7315]|uniref:hypothetical protein n=1 Tax=Haloimpatiens sp. FM7315 TaxID=3298609 RepID=UPI00370A5665
MADVTFGVKVNQELKEKLTSLMRTSGLQGKDFMQNLINIYETEKLKDSVPEVAQDINELQYLTSRINSIYINLAHRIDNIKDSNKESYENILQERNSALQNFEIALKDLKAKNELLSKNLTEFKNENKDLKSELSQIQDTNSSNKLLIKEYNEKIFEFSSKLNELKKHTEENIKIKKSLEEYKLKIDSKDSMLKDKIAEIENKEKIIENLKNSLELVKKSKESLSKDLRDKLTLEKDKSILELKISYQDKINDLNTEYNDKIKNLLLELERPKNINKDTNPSNINDTSDVKY